MSKYRSIAMIGGTAACALGIGFFMQRDQGADQPSTTFESTKVLQSELVPVSSAGFSTSEETQLELEDITLTSATPEDVVEAASELQTLPDAPTDPDVPKLGCGIDAAANATNMANVHLSMSAPCLPNERVTVHHNGMMFTDTTDEAGALSVTIPALSENAVFIVAFSNGDGVVAQADVPDLSEYDRVVLQWADAQNFQIHAREFGASYGEPGHVWSGSEAGAAKGVVSRLGEPETLAPQLAEVYTFPTVASEQKGVVALSIEAEVTASNCGREVMAQSLELREGGSLRTRDVVLSVPDCDAVGDFLVLNNLVDDLKIAAN